MTYRHTCDDGDEEKCRGCQEDRRRDLMVHGIFVLETLPDSAFKEGSAILENRAARRARRARKEKK